MGASAFDILILPAFWATSGGLAVAVTIKALTAAIEALCRQASSPAPTPAGPPRLAYSLGHTPHRGRRRVAHRA